PRARGTVGTVASGRASGSGRHPVAITRSLARLNRILVTVLVVLVLAGLGAELLRDRARSHGGAGEASRPDATRILKGEVVEADAAAGTIVVSEAIGSGGMTREVTIAVPATARVRVRGKPGSLSDLRVGGLVTARCSRSGGTLLARDVTVGEPAPAES